MKSIASIPGIKAKHAVVSKDCVKFRGAAGAAEFAFELLKDEFLRLRVMEANKDAKFHFVLTVERED